MTGPVPIGSIRLYDQIDPLLTAGVYRVGSAVEVADANNPANRLAAPPADQLHVEVGGPRFRLGPAEIAAVHPAAGASGAFGTRLPHVVLGRHTLPWERRTAGGAPWLALLVARKAAGGPGAAGGGAGEVTLSTGPLQAAVGQPVYDAINAAEPADPQEPVTVARFTDVATLRAVLPSQADAALLAHVRQVNVADTALDLGDDDGWFAVVAANRLPLDAGGGTDYVAMLVSLEARDDLWALPAAGPAPPLVVLTSWEFTTASGGTFESLAAGLDVAPFGDTVDGTVPLVYTDRAGVTGTATYRGPLVGAPPAQLPALPGDRDLSLDAAFELGRLLGVADGRFTREIVAWHRSLDALARTMSSRQLVQGVLAGATAARPAATGSPAPPAAAGPAADDGMAPPAAAGSPPSPATSAAAPAADAGSPAWLTAAGGAGERFSAAVAAALRARAVAHPKADPWGVHPAARSLLDREEPS